MTLQRVCTRIQVVPEKRGHRRRCKIRGAEGGRDRGSGGAAAAELSTSDDGFVVTCTVIEHGGGDARRGKVLHSCGQCQNCKSFDFFLLRSCAASPLFLYAVTEVASDFHEILKNCLNP